MVQAFVDEWAPEQKVGGLDHDRVRYVGVEVHIGHGEDDSYTSRRALGGDADLQFVGRANGNGIGAEHHRLVPGER